MSEQTNAPAGWYDDGTGRQRWFDGAQWGAYADEQASPAAHPEPTAAVAEEAPVVIRRRTRRAPFAPPSPSQGDDTSGVAVSRNWALGLRAANAKKESGLTRNRKIAGELPEWAPLPPGELAVDRTTRRGR